MINRRVFLKSSGAGGAVLFAHPMYSAGQRIAPKVAEQIVHSETPRNSEPTLDKLIQSWITPNDLFYVRSHAPVPEIDADQFRLSVSGMVHKPFEISLNELAKEFKQHSAIATLTCAGNRRSEHSLVKKVGGVPWDSGATSNAKWSGVRLSDLLKRAGIQTDAKYVWFEGVDEIEKSGGIIPFGASIPLNKAMMDSDTMPGTLVAHQMNGQPLPPDHGFPIRTVVPGFIGARSVKWLGKIIVSDKPSTNHYVATAYKLVTEGTKEEWASSPPIDNFVVNSVICQPARASNVSPGELIVNGYAIPTGLQGRTVSKVELSTDGGKTWTPSKFTTAAQPFCWRFWSGKVKIGSSTDSILARAVDSGGAAQPKTVAWNMKGYLFNAWYRLGINVRS